MMATSGSAYRTKPANHFQLPAFLWALFAYFVIALLLAWPAAALYFDLPLAHLRVAAAIVYLLGMGALLCLAPGKAARFVVTLVGCVLVAGWWLTLKPSNNEPWQPDVSHTATIDVEQGHATIHNFRQCDYRAEFDYTCRWSTQTVNLADIRGVDLFMDYWGSPWIAHTILSFDLGAGQHVAFSIETRKQVGQSYSAVRGFFRQYTLISVVSDERDVVRLRTNYRKGEDLYLFHTRATAAFAQRLFTSYVALTNHLAQQPQWYNAITHNCTTEIYTFQAMRGQPYDWRILLNGKADRMLYDDGDLAGDVPFKTLKTRAYINPAAKKANDDPDFSTKIRVGRPGFADEMTGTQALR